METRFWCYIIIFVFLAISGIFLTIKISEKFIILQNINEEPDTVRVSTKVLPNSLKYRGHRYDRHHIRSNPHTRTYYRS